MPKASKNYNGQQYHGLSVLLPAAGNITWDVGAEQVAEVTVDQALALLPPVNHVAGSTYVLIVKQDGVGGWGLTWDATVLKWPNGVVPSITPTPNATDIFTFVSDGTYLYGTYALNY